MHHLQLEIHLAATTVSGERKIIQNMSRPEIEQSMLIMIHYFSDCLLTIIVFVAILPTDCNVTLGEHTSLGKFKVYIVCIY